MSQEYKAPVWPRRYPQHILLALVAVLVSTVLAAGQERGGLTNGFEKWYLWRYALASYRAMVNDRPRRAEFLVQRGARFRIRTIPIRSSEYRDWLQQNIY